KDAVPGRGNDILNYLMEIVALENVKSKTMSNSKTVAFIDERLHYLVQELGDVEQSAASYKSQTALTDPSASSMYLSQAAGLNVERDNYESRINMINSVLSSLNASVGDVIPSSSGIEDRSEEHTSELQSREKLVCRLLL